MSVAKCTSLLLSAALLVLCSGCFVPVATTTTEPATTTDEQLEVVSQKPDPNRVIPITFEDLDIPGLDPDSVFEPKLLTQRVLDLDGKRVRIAGFMHGGSVYSTRGIKQFILLREKECPFGEGGQAHHAIAVTLDGEGTRFVITPLTVEGKLAVEPVPDSNTGNTLYLYTLTDASISK